MTPRLLAAGALWVALLSPTFAADVPLSFSAPILQQRYSSLLEELRCLVCQNQSLADSHAELAQDLRNEVYRMLGEGHADADILAFMVQRYGDFVLYRPPLKSSTWLLWLGPGVALTVAISSVVVLSRRRKSLPESLSENERAHLDRMLADRHSDS